MKKTVIKAVCLISSYIMLIVTACGCQSVDSGKQPSSTKPSSQAASSANSVIHEYVDPVRTYGNLPGNINNRGLASKQGEWTYFASSTGIYKIKDDNSNLTRLCDARGADHINVNVVGDWIYYHKSVREITIGSSTQRTYNLYKMKIDGTEDQKVI